MLCNLSMVWITWKKWLRQNLNLREVRRKKHIEQMVAIELHKRFEEMLSNNKYIYICAPKVVQPCNEVQPDVHQPRAVEF